jgi:hypothetical protein
MASRPWVAALALSLSTAALAEPADAPVVEDGFLWASVAAVGLHTVDHGLSGDWWCSPGALRALPNCTPAQGLISLEVGSLYVFTLLSARYWWHAGPLLNILIDSVLLLAFEFPHEVISFENAATVYERWTTLRANAFEADWPVMGALGEAWVIATDVALSGHLALNIADGVQHGFTWLRAPRKEPSRMALSIQPVRGGAMAVVGQRF